VEDRIDTHLSNLINLIRTKYVSTETELKPMDLARKSQFLTLDIITDLAFDVPFGNIDHDEDVHLYIQSTEETMQVAIMLSTIPIMNSFLNLPIIGDMIFPSSKDKTGPGRLIRFVFSTFDFFYIYLLSIFTVSQRKLLRNATKKTQTARRWI